MHQVEMISLEELVPMHHNYRKFMKIWSFESAQNRLKSLEKDNPHKGYGILKLFKCLLLQFMEDLSDRELERYVQENTAAKWFCGFNLKEETPDHTVFCRMRARIGTQLLSQIFGDLRGQLKQRGFISEVFTFVDASHLIAKASLWEERDEVIRAKYEKLNNETLPKVAVDKQARIGCKGQSKYWYGYKKHVSVDMKMGFINKIAITPANQTDAQGLKHVCPKQGAIYADKGYCTRPAKHTALENDCHLAAIKKNNMKDKNKDQDRYYSRLRSPYERVFSQSPHRVRYRGIAKNQFAAFMEAICFNMKRLIALNFSSFCFS